MVWSRAIHKETCEYLEVLIDEYLFLLNVLFSNHFKPQHHFLVHHPTCMRLFRPLAKISCMRFEAKHKESKLISASTTSRIDVSKTIAIEHQLMMSYKFLNKKV